VHGPPRGAPIWAGPRRCAPDRNLAHWSRVPGLLQVGPGPRPLLTASHSSLCLSVPSFFRALPPSLPLLLCSVSPVAPCSTSAHRLSLGPYASAWAHIHTRVRTPERLARSNAHSLRLTQMCPHLHYWIEKSPSLVCAARDNDSCGKGIVLVLPDHVRTAIGGVTHFCPGMVRPAGPSDPISGRDMKWA